MWTVSATWFKQANGLSWNVLATFEHSDGRKYVDVPFSGILSTENARRIFGNQIAQYEAAGFSPVDGAFDMTPPAPPPSEPPKVDAAAAAQRDFNMKRQALVTAFKEDLPIGLVSQEDFDKLQADALSSKAVLLTAMASPVEIVEPAAVEPAAVLNV